MARTVVRTWLGSGIPVAAVRAGGGWLIAVSAAFAEGSVAEDEAIAAADRAITHFEAGYRQPEGGLDVMIPRQRSVA